MKGRTTPRRTPAQQLEHERRQALTSLDVTALRDWMARTGLERALISDDDTMVLQAAHEARVVDLRLPRQLRDESARWLREHTTTK